jgi:CRP-like cAMP-binding protein
MLENIKKYIAQHINLTEQEFNHFASFVTERKLKKRQYLVQEGDICRQLYFVNEGCLRLYEVDQSGKEHNIQFAVENWWTGDLDSYLTETPARLNAECLENCQLLVIAKKDMEQIYHDIPQFERLFRLIMQNAYVASQRRLLSVMSKTALERYLEFTEKYPHILQRVPNHHIASYLGITPESLSRLRKEYKMYGV